MIGRCPPSILVVENEALIALYFCTGLADLECRCAGCAAGKHDALAIAERGHPDLAIVDAWLDSRSDGLEVVSTLRRVWAIPSVVVSGGASIMEAVDAGAIGFLDKQCQRTASDDQGGIGREHRGPDPRAAAGGLHPARVRRTRAAMVSERDIWAPLT